MFFPITRFPSGHIPGATGTAWAQPPRQRRVETTLWGEFTGKEKSLLAPPKNFHQRFKPWRGAARHTPGGVADGGHGAVPTLHAGRMFFYWKTSCFGSGRDMKAKAVAIAFLSASPSCRRCHRPRSRAGRRRSRWPGGRALRPHSPFSSPSEHVPVGSTCPVGFGHGIFSRAPPPSPQIPHTPAC